VIAKAHELVLTVGLTKTEQAIFVCLATKAEALVSREELLLLLKGRAPHTIDSHVMEIRRKLAQHGCAAKIVTVVGAGFILRLH
jgi:DNA-binding response OmpR family regulator